MLRTLKKNEVSICGPSSKVCLTPGRRWNYSYLQFSPYCMSSIPPASFKKDWRQQKLSCEASSSTRRKGKEIFSAWSEVEEQALACRQFGDGEGTCQHPHICELQISTHISSWCTVTRCQFWRWLDVSELCQHWWVFQVHLVGPGGASELDWVWLVDQDLISRQNQWDAHGMETEEENCTWCNWSFSKSPTMWRLNSDLFLETSQKKSQQQLQKKKLESCACLERRGNQNLFLF